MSGRVRISAEGKDLYKFINELHKSRIGCSGQYCRKDVFYADISRNFLKEAESIAASLDVRFTAAEYETFSSKLRRYRRRFGFIVGAVAVLFGALYFSNVVVTIDIKGNSTISDEVILAALDELDIKKGTPLKNINFHKTENELRLMIKGISWAGIRHTGNRLVVDIREAVPPPETERKRVPCNLVAAKDAEITYTSVFDGMLMHKVGDFVPKGTLIVNGVICDDTGHTTLHHAMGEIRGQYEETVVFTGEYNAVKKVPTGEKKKEDHLCLFSAKIPLFFGKNDFSSYNSEVTESYLHFFGKTLPIGLSRELITETEITEKLLTHEELSAELMEKIYLYEKNFLGGDTVIIDRSITEENTDETLTYTVTYRLEGNIGVQRDIFVK